MDLRSGFPYSLLQHGIITSYPSLQQNIATDVAIIGGGISGALTAWYLSQAGFDVVVVDRRHIGMGSTVASTSLLQYEIDVPLYELINKVGEKSATRSYCLCREAIQIMASLAHKLRVKDSFRKKPSFQFASYHKHQTNLQKEFSLRKKIGFPVHWLDEKDVREKYGFQKPCGILSADGAEADAYLLTHALLQKCISRGMQVFDHTEITKISHRRKGVELITNDRKKISAHKLVIACGYESQQYIPKKVQDLNSTYAIVSEPGPKKEFWYKNSLIWETKEPYLYLRTTADNRILVGGKDIPWSDPQKRDKLLSSKARALELSFKKLFPTIPFRTDFKWAGSFASTKDGLPYIGSIPQRPHTFFALGLGGNGITFSIIAARIIRDNLIGKKNTDAGLFSFER
ncbi:MAG TPA: FAD-dependent oxidoreductase [Chitinophagaceae bacterium]|nr:FAD-dependent oxidoreductase [Chitinophagaceae bacterium]